MAICCEATPQQAVEKKAEFNAAASPPSAAASGDSFNCRKKVQAPRPRMNKARGWINFERTIPSAPNGRKARCTSANTSGEDAPALPPMTFKSLQHSRESAGDLRPSGILLGKWSIVVKFDIPGEKTPPEQASQHRRQQRGNQPYFWFGFILSFHGFGKPGLELTQS